MKRDCPLIERQDGKILIKLNKQIYPEGVCRTALEGDDALIAIHGGDPEYTIVEMQPSAIEYLGDMLNFLFVEVKTNI